jgi:hypothetical protein
MFNANPLCLTLHVHSELDQRLPEAEPPLSVQSTAPQVTRAHESQAESVMRTTFAAIGDDVVAAHVCASAC